MAGGIAEPGTSSGCPSVGGGIATCCRSQRILAGMAVLSLVLLLYHGYGAQHRGRPTEQQMAAVRYAVNLNTADKAELQQLPGIGPNLAEAILAYRRQVGRYDSVDDLTRIQGIGGQTLAKVRPWVRVEDTPEHLREPVPELQKLERQATKQPTTATVAAAPKPLKIQPGDPPINVNVAEESELMRLPGIGPTLASRIIQTRAQRPFESADDLQRVKGIGVKTVQNLRPFVVFR
jgi:competence protein ComEA